MWRRSGHDHLACCVAASRGLRAGLPPGAASSARGPANRLRAALTAPPHAGRHEALRHLDARIVRTYVRDLGRPSRRTTPASLAARNLTSAEQAAFEIAFISLEQARELVELYAEKGDPKYERAALKYR